MDKVTIKKIPKKILVIKPGSLGDIVHSLPFLHVMKDTFPRAEIHWIVSRGLEGLLQNNPMVKKLWIINKDQWKNPGKIKETVSEVKTLFRELKRETYDIAVDLQGLLRSGLLANASHAPVRVGFKEAREGSRLFYTHRIRGGRDVHAVDRYLKVASSLGCEIDEIKFPMPLIKESEKVKNVKNNMGKYAVIVSGARWKTKRWLPERFGKLAYMLNIKSIVVGSTADAKISKEIEAMSGGKAVSMAGLTDLGELISLIRGATYVVTNDSGPMHIAAAFNIPTVAIFGPTSPVRTGPYGRNNIIVKGGTSCAPCYKRECRHIRCMKEVSVEQVYEAVKTVTGNKWQVRS
ncbi:MAG: lipopolysaccharide heptosyltransferase II [Nitrospirae bacterium]|nr:lipopolysaccharide heptosyltransferase II [Nitrospirota bacterium]